MSSGTRSSTSDGTGGIRYFSDESEDCKEYRRWKLWLSHKFKTLDKLQADARGPYRFTRLSGKPLETVEHVDPAEYQQDGGEQVLLRLLDARFPERGQTDELAEVLNRCFQCARLRAKVFVLGSAEPQIYLIVVNAKVASSCSSEKRSARRCEVAIRISLSAVTRRLLWWMMKIPGCTGRTRQRIRRGWLRRCGAVPCGP